MKTFLVLLFLTLPVLSIFAADLTTEEIVKRAELAMKVRGVQGVNTMTIIDEKGRERVRKIAQVAKLVDDGKTDLKQGKVTLPLLYGLQSNHPDREELAMLVETNEFASQANRVREILDKIDTKSFLIWSALKERDLALKAISICPNQEGKEVLEAFLTGMFGDIDELLPG